MSYFISEKCVGCGLCAKNCPIGVIHGERKKLHVIDEMECMECGVCGKICPVSAVQNGAGEPVEKMKRGDWPKPKFDLERCFSCSSCKEMCIEGCIDMIRQEDEITFKPELVFRDKCISCGACVSVCGVSAVELV